MSRVSSGEFGHVALGPRGTSTRVVFGGGRGMYDTLHTPLPRREKTDACGHSVNVGLNYFFICRAGRPLDVLR